MTAPSLVAHLGPEMPQPAAPSPILVAAGVTKSYLPHGLLELLRGRRSPPRARYAPDDRAMALQHVDFELPRGCSLGVIGRNGAGKSTLLRLLAGLSRPTSGTVETRGRVRALLELGGGFLEEMTGRENARAMLGIDGVVAEKRPEAMREVEEFAGIGAFLDEPVRTYSAGMRLRLAYALAVAVRPDLLVADEVLAVGDEEFQRRCSQHLMRFLDGGGTLVLATHNLYHVEKLCRRAIWLESGRVVVAGPAREVTAAYRASVEASLGSRAGAGPSHSPGDRAAGSTHDVAGGTLTLRLLAPDGATTRRVAEGEDLCLEIEEGLPLGAVVQLEILRPDGTRVFAAPGYDRRSLRLPACPLLPGRYRAHLVATGPSSRELVADVEFDCVGASRELGTVRLAHLWG